MADFLQSLDPQKLISIGTGVVFLLIPFTSGPSYNFPLLLFGVYVQENSEAIHSLRLFTLLLGSSFLWDLLWLFNSQGGGFFSRLALVVVMLLKIPLIFTFSAAMRQRGAQFSGLGLPGGSETLWSMPGGFTSVGGNAEYSRVEDPAPPRPHVGYGNSSGGPPPPPSTNSGGPQAPGAYQSV